MAIKKLTLGIDIGAYKVGLALYDGKSLVDFRYNPHPHRKTADYELWKEWIQAETYEFIDKRNVSRAGVCSAGIVLEDTVVLSPNFQLLNGKNLVDLFPDINVVHVDNDAKAFLVCEKSIGVAQAYNTFVGISLGTGIGGAIFINGQIYRGLHNAAGELGHMQIQKGASFEELASSRFFSNYGNPKVLQEQASKDDKEALAVFREYGEVVGTGVANIINILDPEAVVIGGGLSCTFPYFSSSMREAMTKGTLLDEAHKIPVKQSKFGREGPALGVAILASQE